LLNPNDLLELRYENEGYNKTEIFIIFSV